MIPVSVLLLRPSEETNLPPPIRENGLLKSSPTILFCTCFFFIVAMTAQAFIKLGQYQEAITDCEWALKVSLTPKSPLTSQSSLHTGQLTSTLVSL